MCQEGAQNYLKGLFSQRKILDFSKVKTELTIPPHASSKGLKDSFDASLYPTNQSYFPLIMESPNLDFLFFSEPKFSCPTFINL